MNSSLKALVGIATLLFGLTVYAEDWPSVSISSLVSSKYLGFGTGNLLSEDPVVQSDLHVTWKNGFYVDLWNSRSLKGKWNDGSLGNEVDYGIGWNGTLAPHLKLSIGLTYLDEPNAFTLGAGDILYPRVFLTRDFKYLSVTAGFANFTTLPNSGFNGGNLLNLGVSRGYNLCDGKVSVRGSVILVYDFGTLGSGEGFILRGNIGTDWNITKNLTWNIIGINWFLPMTPKDTRVTDAVFYSGFSFRFN